jgi:hypothetical protein
MNIFYTAYGLPMIEVDGVIYNFNRQNAAFIVGELSPDIETCNEIKTNVVESINSAIAAKTLSPTSSYQDINGYINSLSELSEFHVVNDIIDESIDTHLQLTTPKPHETWGWNRSLKAWEAPVQYPTGADEYVYIWSDDYQNWIPAEPAPHVSWVWDHRTHEFVSPVSYPLDAQEGEFVWDEDKLSWVLNV